MRHRVRCSMDRSIHQWTEVFDKNNRTNSIPVRYSTKDRSIIILLDYKYQSHEFVISCSSIVVAVGGDGVHDTRNNDKRTTRKGAHLCVPLSFAHLFSVSRRITFSQHQQQQSVTIILLGTYTSRMKWEINYYNNIRIYKRDTSPTKKEARYV